MLLGSRAWSGFARPRGGRYAVASCGVHARCRMRGGRGVPAWLLGE